MLVIDNTNPNWRLINKQPVNCRFPYWQLEDIKNHHYGIFSGNI